MLNILKTRVQTFKLDASIFGSELPPDGGSSIVSTLLPSLCERAQCLSVRYTLVQTLLAQDTQLDLCHVQPTAMLRRVVKHQLGSDTVRLLWWKMGVQASFRVCVEIVHHQLNSLNAWKMDVHQVAHALGKVPPIARLGHLYMPPVVVGSKHHEEVAHTIVLVLMVVTSRLTRFHRLRVAYLFALLFVAFINTYQWTERVWWQVVQVIARPTTDAPKPGPKRLVRLSRLAEVSPGPNLLASR